MTVYMLTATDLTHLGGPMGSEYTKVIFNKPYKNLSKAKAAAEKDYEQPIEWQNQESNKFWTSGDLGHVTYDIRKITVE